VYNIDFSSLLNHLVTWNTGPVFKMCILWFIMHKMKIFISFFVVV